MKTDLFFPKPRRAFSLLIALGICLSSSLFSVSVQALSNPPVDSCGDYFATSSNEMTGSPYRKIALNGVPMPDQPPEADAESDTEREESYVDAFTLGLKHSTTDIYVPLQGNQLALAVRRDSTEQLWGSHPSQLAPDDRPELAFGPCWNSNLSARIEMVTLIRNSGQSGCEVTRPDYVFVTDEEGATHRFFALITCDKNATDPVANAELHFFPLPSNRMEQQTFFTSLTLTPDSQLRWQARQRIYAGLTAPLTASNLTALQPLEFEFKRKHDTKITFKEIAPAKLFRLVDNGRQKPGSPPPPPPDQTLRTYARVDTIQDRWGNTLTYENYPEPPPNTLGNFVRVGLIPQTIRSGTRSLSITINPATGRVSQILDPRGKTYLYEYTTQDGYTGLAFVQTPEGGQTHYSYSKIPQADNTPHDPDAKPTPQQETFHHLNVEKITDPNGHFYSFEYKLDPTKWAYSSFKPGYYSVPGEPCLVEKVHLPNGETASFATGSDIRVARAVTPANPTAIPQIQGLRSSNVTDATGKTTHYEFTNPSVVMQDEFESYFFGDDQRDVPFLVVYQKLIITHPTNITETFEYSLAANLAVSKVTDYSGNITKYEYENSLAGTPWDIFQRFPFLPSTLNLSLQKYGEPTKKIEAFDKPEQRETTYTYQPQLRVMESESVRYKYQSDTVRTEMVRDPVTGSVVLERRLKNGILNQKTAYTYDHVFKAFVTGKTVSTSDEASSKVSETTYEPSPDGYVFKEIRTGDNGPETTQNLYDANGNKTQVTDPRNHVTTFAYDDNNRLQTVTYANNDTKAYTYDLRGNKQTETMGNGTVMRYEYNATNLLKKQGWKMDGDGTALLDASSDIVTEFEYDAVNSKKAEIDPLGRRTEFAYDNLHRLVTTTKPSAPINGQPTTLVTTFDYDVDSNPGSSAFNVSGFKPTKVAGPKIVNGKPLISQVTYDALYRPVVERTEYEPGVFATSSKEYDAAGNVVLSKDPLTRETHYLEYDALGKPGRIEHPDGIVERFVYNGLGLPVQQWLDSAVTGEGSRYTHFDYDLAGRLRKTYLPPLADGRNLFQETRYDLAGNVSQQIDTAGQSTFFAYDERNRKTDETVEAAPYLDENGQMQTAAAATKLTAYDAAGNVVQQTDPRGNSSVTRYDKANRAVAAISAAVTVEDPAINNGATTLVYPAAETVYDRVGNVTETWLSSSTGQSATSPLTRVRRTALNVYDALRRLTSTKDALGITVTNEYDELGNRTAVVDGKGQRSTFTYDGLSRNTAITDPATRSVSFEFDAMNKQARVNSRDQRTTYGYDLAHRPTTTTYVGRTQDNRAMAYDGFGNLKSVTENGGTARNVAYTYDALNRQETETSGGLLHHYSYDNAGNRNTVIYDAASNGTEQTTSRVLISAYDARNRVTSIAERAGLVTPLARTTEYAYDQNGNIRRVKNLSGSNVVSTVEKTYDALNRVIAITNAGFYTYSHAYDLSGNLVRSSEVYPANQAALNRVVSNGYDAINRLTRETTTGAQATTTLYGFDNANNRTLKTIQKAGQANEVTHFDYNDLNQLTGLGAVQGQPTITFSYDFDGNRSTRVQGGVTDNYNFDYENRLESLNKAQGTSTGLYSYLYDYRTRRVSRTEAGLSTQVVFSGGTSVREIEANATTVEYVRGSDYGGGVGGILYTLRGGTPSFTHYNSRGDVTAKTDASGAVTYQATYEAFGKRTAETGSTLDRQKSNTKEEDPTGLTNEGHRYRDLETGEFITRDPMGFVDGPNMYAYVGQNPWTKFDPEGLAGEFVQYAPDIAVTADVDGAPTTYAPSTYHEVTKKRKDGTSYTKTIARSNPGFQPLDNELNAHVKGKASGSIVGYMTALTPNGKVTGIPQGPSDPAPGYYVSTTAYRNEAAIRNDGNAVVDPKTYVDSTQINYIVRRTLPVEGQKGPIGTLGDYVAVHDFKTNKTGFGIIGDTGHSNGAEMSVAYMRNLGYPGASANNSPEEKGRYAFRVFPNSATLGSFTGASQANIDSSARKQKLNADFSVEQEKYDKTHK